MSLNKIIRVLAVCLIVAGLSIAVPYTYFNLTNKAAVTHIQPVQVVAPELTPQVVIGTPNRIQIPSLNIDLPVIGGAYDSATGQWTLTNDKAQFALLSTQSNNESGNTLIYGHATDVVFGSLYRLVPGAEVILTTDNGYEFRYTYASTEAVSPINTDVLMYQGAPRLTVQTCSGTFSQNRQLYYFNLKTYKKV